MLGQIMQSLVTAPVTESYPFVHYPEPERLRGKLFWDPQKCTGCQLCVKDCPSDALELIVIDKVNKRFVLKYHVDRCTYCSQCVENCRFKCIGLSNEEWELAASSREPFMVYYGREEDVQILLARYSREQMEAPQRE